MPPRLRADDRDAAVLLENLPWAARSEGVAFARDDEDEMVFHVAVVAGNRSGRSAAESFRIELRDVGLELPVTCAIALGESDKNVDDLLASTGQRESRSGNAREMILDILEEEGAQESDALDARVAAQDRPQRPNRQEHPRRARERRSHQGDRRTQA